MSHGLHPEMDDSGLLAEEGHRCYQQLIGSAQWIVGIGRADIQYAVTSLNRFSSCPRERQLQYLIKMFSYLKEFLEREIIIDHTDQEFFKQFGEPDECLRQRPWPRQSNQEVVHRPGGICWEHPRLLERKTSDLHSDQLLHG